MQHLSFKNNNNNNATEKLFIKKLITKQSNVINLILFCNKRKSDLFKNQKVCGNFPAYHVENKTLISLGAITRLQ